MRKAVAVTAILVIVFLIQPIVKVVKIAEADPFSIFHQIESRSDAIPLKITIFSPQNDTAYSSEKITLSFYVDRPNLDRNGSSIDKYHSAIINITYTLDDRTEQAYTIWKNVSYTSSSEFPNFNTYLFSLALPAGNHRLIVYAEAVVFAGGLDIFFTNGSSTISFSTQLLKPSPTPTPIEVDGGDSSMLNQTTLSAIVIVIAILSIALGSLVYLRKHWKKVSDSHD